MEALFANMDPPRAPSATSNALRDSASTAENEETEADGIQHSTGRGPDLGASRRVPQGSTGEDGRTATIHSEADEGEKDVL